MNRHLQNGAASSPVLRSMAMKTMFGGTSNSSRTNSVPASAAFFFVGEDAAEEIDPDRQGGDGALLVPAQGLVVVIADPDAGAQRRGKADEPGVRIFVRRAGLPGQGDR